MNTGKQCKTRSDKGLILVTDRDQRALMWIADQYAVRFDQIQQLLTRWPGGELKGELIAETTVKDQISRWKRAGWVEYHRVLADGPGWAWITRKGLQVIGWDDFYVPKVPSPTRLKHIYAVNQIRLWMDLDGFSWVSEREYRTMLGEAKKGETTGAIPDAIVTSQKSGKVAVEVELTPKKAPDLQAKLKRLAGAFAFDSDGKYGPIFPAIWFYVPNERIKKLVQGAIDRSRADYRSRVSVGIQEDLIG